MRIRSGAVQLPRQNLPPTTPTATAASPGSAPIAGAGGPSAAAAGSLGNSPARPLRPALRGLRPPPTPPAVGRRTMAAIPPGSLRATIRPGMATSGADSRRARRVGGGPACQLLVQRRPSQSRGCSAPGGRLAAVSQRRLAIAAGPELPTAATGLFLAERSRPNPQRGVVCVWAAVSGWLVTADAAGESAARERGFTARRAGTNRPRRLARVGSGDVSRRKLCGRPASGRHVAGLGNSGRSLYHGAGAVGRELAARRGTGLRLDAHGVVASGADPADVSSLALPAPIVVLVAFLRRIGARGRDGFTLCRPADDRESLVRFPGFLDAATLGRRGRDLERSGIFRRHEQEKAARFLG